MLLTCRLRSTIRCWHVVGVSVQHVCRMRCWGQCWESTCSCYTGAAIVPLHESLTIHGISLWGRERGRPLGNLSGMYSHIFLLLYTCLLYSRVTSLCFYVVFICTLVIYMYINKWGCYFVLAWVVWMFFFESIVKVNFRSCCQWETPYGGVYIHCVGLQSRVAVYFIAGEGVLVVVYSEICNRCNSCGNL